MWKICQTRILRPEMKLCRVHHDLLSSEVFLWRNIEFTNMNFNWTLKLVIQWVNLRGQRSPSWDHHLLSLKQTKNLFCFNCHKMVSLYKILATEKVMFSIPLILRPLVCHDGLCMGVHAWCKMDLLISEYLKGNTYRYTWVSWGLVN